MRPYAIPYRCLTIKTKLVETDGFEPPRFLGARFTVWCNQPLCHVSKTYHIETHSAPLTTLFLSIQDAPGMNPADPLGCLYLSIQIESVFLYGTRYENRTRLSALKGQRPNR